jgi:hypothetical protein
MAVAIRAGPSPRCGAKWMAWSIPRIRSAVLATRPLRPYAHQDDAVFGVMLSQPRLRFLLADEPGTGKTLMTGMYLAEGRRRELIPGKTIIMVPAHLVTKWIRELQRFFGIQVHPITPEIGRDPLDLRADVDTWIVSVDLYTYNADVRRKVVGTRASWSLAVFDEAHRLTPTSQYLGAAAQLAELSHHLLLLTATPHRGKEHFFRALLHLLDPAVYTWDDAVKDYADMVLRPGRDNFLRRMKEDLRDLDGNLLFPPRFAETRDVHLTPAEADAYVAVMAYVDTWYDASSVLARSIYGKRAASCIPSALATLKRRAEVLGASQTGRVDRVAPRGFERPDFAGADVDSEEAWEAAERSVVEARSRDRKAELAAVQDIVGMLELRSPPRTSRPSGRPLGSCWPTMASPQPLAASCWPLGCQPPSGSLAVPARAPRAGAWTTGPASSWHRRPPASWAGGCWCAAAAATASWPSTPATARPPRRWSGWSEWPEPGGRWRRASSRPRARSAWTTTRSAAGRAGIATSPWPCWPMHSWPSSAPRPPVPSGQKGTRQPKRRARPASPDGARDPPAAGRAGVDHPGQAGLCAGLVTVASTPSGPRQARTLPPTRKPSAAGVLMWSGLSMRRFAW